MEEELYYIYINGEQRGPFEKHHLKAEGISPDTMVWRPGMSEWVSASSLPELQEVLYSYNPTPPPVNPYGQPGYGYNNTVQPPYNGYNRNTMMPGSYPPGWTNWLGWAIAATVVGLFGYLVMAIPGIIGIVKANEANTLARMGDPRAFSVNSTAKAWTLVGLIVNGVLILLGILLIIIFGAALFSIAGAGAY